MEQHSDDEQESIDGSEVFDDDDAYRDETDHSEVDECPGYPDLEEDTFFADTRATESRRDVRDRDVVPQNVERGPTATAEHLLRDPASTTNYFLA